MSPISTCPACGGPLIQKNRPRLLGVGLALLLSGLLPLASPWLWVPAIVLVLAALYLIAWGTKGGGHWCRHCKNFPWAGPKS